MYSFAHALNLTWFDRFLLCIMSTSLVTSNLIKFFLKWDALRDKLHYEFNTKYPGFRTLFPKKCTARSNLLRSVSSDWAFVQNVWVQSLNKRGLHPELREIILGVQVQIKLCSYWLRRTMIQERLNHLMLLSVHKTKTDELNLTKIANQLCLSK